MEVLVLLGGPMFSIEVSSLPPTKYGVVSSAAIKWCGCDPKWWRFVNRGSTQFLGLCSVSSLEDSISSHQAIISFLSCESFAFIFMKKWWFFNKLWFRFGIWYTGGDYRITLLGNQSRLLIYQKWKWVQWRIWRSKRTHLTTGFRWKILKQNFVLFCF